MDLCVLSVGDELLAGDILDRNAWWIAGELNRRGHHLVSVATVGDDVAAIAGAVEGARGACGLLLVSGGLGPTGDDVTRDGVARAFGLDLVEHPDLLAQAQGRNARLSEGARRQAALPEGARVLANDRGTAPGFLVGDEAFAVACLPGPPGELRPMVTALLDARAPRGEGLPPRRLKLCGLSESVVGERLDALMRRQAGERAAVRVGVTVSRGICTVTVRGEDAAAQDRALETAREALQPYVFGEGETDLATACVQRLQEQGLKVTTAESCTGGLLSGALTSVPGSSAVFDEGAVTYANAAKAARLAVPAAMLEAHGAVSEPVARAMAAGARERAGADVALSVTGVAGPDGGTEEKPVGTVWFGLADERGTAAHQVAWGGSREDIRTRSVNLALALLWGWMAGRIETTAADA